MSRPVSAVRPYRRARMAAAAVAAFIGLVSAAALTSCTVEITATRYALVYGAANYDDIVDPDDSSDLDTPDDDAQDMKAALESAGWTVTSADPAGEVDKQEILDDIAALVPVVDSDSSVLIYFSGHGTLYFGETCILPTDAIADVTGNLVPDNLIAPSELLEALDALPCRNRIVILDTCYSGGFVAATDTGTVDSAPQNYGILDDGTETSALLTALGSYADLLGDAFDSYDPYTPIVVTAAGAEELSYETSSAGEGNGVFTYYFLRAASSGDTDGNGRVTIQEAYRYAKANVGTYWNDYYFAYDTGYGSHADFLPRISGNARDIVIF